MTKNVSHAGHEVVVLNFIDAGIPGVPDGMAIDEDDNLWITSFEGHQVSNHLRKVRFNCDKLILHLDVLFQIIHFNPKNRMIIKRIQLDALQVTSVAFGGSNMNNFLVTTGRYKMNDTALVTHPHSGYIFEQKHFEVAGRPGVPFKLL